MKNVFSCLIQICFKPSLFIVYLLILAISITLSGNYDMVQPIISDVFFSGKYAVPLLLFFKKGTWNASMIFGYTSIIICMLHSSWQHFTSTHTSFCSRRQHVPVSSLHYAYSLFGVYVLCCYAFRKHHAHHQKHHGMLESLRDAFSIQKIRNLFQLRIFVCCL